MVELNTNNNGVFQPVNLYKTGSQFRKVDDWLNEHDELTQGFKHYYAQVQRAIGERGFVYLLNETLAKEINCHPKTIGRYNSMAREQKLLIIIKTGRANLFLVNNHHWLKLSDEDSLKLKPKLPDKILLLLRQNVTSEGANCSENTSQSIENKENTAILENPLIEQLREVRSMHAEVASHSNFTSSNDNKEKESIGQANTSSTTSNSEQKEGVKAQEKQKSIYLLAIIMKWVLAYAVSKLGTSDEIKDHQAFAAYCLNTGEKDAWIGEFVRNGYVLSPVNPLKDEQANQVEQTSETKRARKFQQTVNSPQQAHKIKQQPAQTEEPKGKYKLELYQAYADWCKRNGQPIDSVGKLARYCLKTGSQDKQVADFRELFIGGKLPVPQPQSPSQPIPVVETITLTSQQQQSATAIEQPTTTIEAEPPSPSVVAATSSSNDCEKVELKVENSLPNLMEQVTSNELGKQAWSELPKDKKQLFFSSVANNLAKQNHELRNWPQERQMTVILAVIHRQLGEAIKADKETKITVILETIGAKTFDSLTNSEKNLLMSKKIDEKGREFFVFSADAARKVLAERYQKEIYLDIGLKQLATNT